MKITAQITLENPKRSNTRQELKPADHKFILHGGSREHQVLPSWVHHPSTDTTKDHSRGSSSSSSSSICKIEVKAEDERDHYESAKRMTSKMRLLQKFRDHEQNNGETNTIVRICSDCKTTKTPLWRSGPQGPKSLCNACGIRQRKARRAMIAAAAAANGTVLATNSPKRTKVKIKENKWRSSYKKPFKIYSPPRGGEKISFEDFALSLSKNLTFRPTFPKDEEEAAILLMALSCGLLHS
ncbi:GATA transcription factor [Actinidia chinensis var. chinensis]|uniref:GATA transcription factor n=1 Tax=Actinidia chinensis var. chinensis TaxID=1590841 RepID=A0A2R6PHF1_ACTCC|nr:GATA transcription factor [Actinidia chinensis var. chinensis]